MTNPFANKRWITTGLTLVTIAVAVSFFFLLRNYLQYQDSQGNNQNGESGILGSLPTPPQYTGVVVNYYLRETSNQLVYRFQLDPQALSLAGVELTFAYNQKLLANPHVSALDKRIALPSQLQEQWVISDQYQARHVVTFFSEDQQPFTNLSWIEITFDKKQIATYQTMSESAFWPLDSTGHTIGGIIPPAEITNSFAAHGVRSQGTVLYTSFSTSVQVNNITYLKQ